MKTERDKFLTEAMGECWHEEDYFGLCKHCKAHNYITNDFSTWEGFGKLFEWCMEQDDKYLSNNPMKLCFLKPDYFADRIYNHLKAKYPLAETIKTADIIE